ncbi:unnamed protein product [Cuscuta campestris]|uniref:Aminotransferase-like plant mobile domain-containing protein n=1 Tax=Cuscuta campestris TaxID=132261 RepID=A0A484M1P7_9ASTE|nr:unnamed protein product [Cuscuta campestris]
MVSPSGGTPTLRTAHFLNPSVTSPDSSSSLPQRFTAAGNKVPPPKFDFRGWRINPLREWGEWVESMRSLHEPLWKKAGIRDAVMNSTYRIHRHDEIVLALARKWNPETNTFLFPWGEASLSLEDMIVLGGFSVLGCCVHSDSNPRDRNIEGIKKKLLKARSELNMSKSKKPTQIGWMVKFMNNKECGIEHEAFLVLWLERFVFPVSTQDTIGTKFLDIAIRLTQGQRIALAPAVLAIIYKNLTIMKKALGGVGSDNTQNCCAILAPFRLVLVWVWERFPYFLHPNNPISDKPRFARWDDLKMDAKSTDFAGEEYLWRPYALGAKNSLLLYKEGEGRWVFVPGGGDEVDELIRCVRVSELVGIEGVIEQYLPHRVAMQFGMDQDHPGLVARADGSPEIAWNFFSRPVLDMKLWVPPRLFESDVTTRYLDWFSKTVNVPDDGDSYDDDDVPLAELVRKEGKMDENTRLLDDDDGVSLAELLRKRRKKDVNKSHIDGETGMGHVEEAEKNGRIGDNSQMIQDDDDDKGEEEEKAFGEGFDRENNGRGECDATTTARTRTEAPEAGGCESPWRTRARGLEMRIRNLQRLVGLMKNRDR